jgi:predicted ATPase
MIHLRKIQLKADFPKSSKYPFGLPVINTLGDLAFASPVTFFIGENGSGKSTLLESIAASAQSVIAGGEDFAQDETLRHAQLLSKHLKLTWNQRTHRGFFLRAEDYFRYARKLHNMIKEFEDDAKEFNSKFSGYALKLAKGAILGQKHELENKYGYDLHSASHGEGFLKIFRERLVPDGLYLLDEPETPLSPQRQLTLLSMIKEMSESERCQFIISTHSPILMALPHATLLSFDQIPVQSVTYEELEHVRLTRDFLNNPESYLKHL